MLTNISDESGNKCKICGRKLRNTSNDKCVDCLRKIYAVSILKELNDIGIDSEISFKKSDLEILKYPDFKLSDYIWTLQELNLLTENSVKNEYSLKDKDTINEFINKYGKYSESEEKERKVKKQSIVKECLLCGKTLKITEFYTSKKTEDGYSEYCKNCDSLIKTSENLLSLLDFVKPNETFEVEDLNHKFDDKLLVLAIVWNLLDNDLLETIEEEKTYKLKDEDTVKNFLNKVSKEEYDHEEIKTSNIAKNTNLMNYFVSNKTEEYFEIIVKGTIENEYLFDILKDLEIFGASLKRIVTYKIDYEKTETLFELKSKIENLDKIIEKLEELNWIKK